MRRVDLSRGHGAMRCYWNGCRCSLCCGAKRDYENRAHAAYRARVRAARKMRRVNLLRAHGSPTHYLYNTQQCRCIACESARRTYDRERYGRANQDVLRERRRQWYRDNRQRAYETHRAYVEANREIVTEKRRLYEACHLQDKARRQRERRARKRNAEGKHTSADVDNQYKRQNGKCYWGVRANPECAISLKNGYHVDHVVPLALGGSNGPENLVLACPSCNQRKGSKHPVDFAGVMF